MVQRGATVAEFGDQEIPVYARLGLQAGAADWLRVALDQGWIQSASPAVFISYCTKDEAWRFQLERFLAPELARLTCPDAREPYRPWSFASVEHGTAKGTQFPVELASQLWRCRAAIVLLSQDYLNSPICAATELPFLAWRHVAQGMPLYVLQVGVVSAGAVVISLPQVNGTWPDFDLMKQTNDRFPGLDYREQKAAKQPNVFDLRKGPGRDRRLAAFAELVHSNLAEQHRRAGEASPQSRGTAADADPPLRPKSVGAFPPIDRFEGRKTERRLLAEALSDPGVGVVALCQIGGAGKTCLALKTIEDLIGKGSSPFEAVFQFTFYGGRSQSDFLHELGVFVGDVLSESRPIEGNEAWLLDVLRRRAILLLLDGVEVIQSSSLNADAGALQQGGVRTLLLWLCNQGDVRSIALVTSRLDMRDLLPHCGGRYQPIELPGLSVDDGVRALQRQGVQATELVMRQVVAELSGHPLGLMVFANSVHRVRDARANAAVVVRRKAELAEAGSLEAKLAKLLAYYQSAIDETDKQLIASVTVFPDGAPADWLREVLAKPVEGATGRRLSPAELAERLDRLAREGILQAVPTLLRTEYTAHPVIRESFRVSASGLVETAARLHLGARPAMFSPKTGLQAVPYVRAVEIYCENGNFAAADQVMSSHLAGGRTLTWLGEWRLLFNLLWQFIQPDRREQCQAALGAERFAELLPLTIDACIALSEWEIAEELCALGATVLKPTQLLGRQADIQMKVGSPAEAERLLRSGISSSSVPDELVPDTSLEFQLKLAAALLEQGRLREAWSLLRDWIRSPPRSLDDLAAWIRNLDDALLCAARVWSRAEVDIAAKFLKAIGRAVPTLPVYRAGQVAFLEWEQLSLRPRSERTSEHWLRMLELARILGDEAARTSTREADGGWMIGILESLNGLGRHQDALTNVPVIVSQLHEHSFYRPWVDIEAGRAHLGLGQVHLARELAARALKQALASRHMLMAGRAARFLNEFPNGLSPNEILARQVVDAIRDDTPTGKEFDLDVPLPGEDAWDEHVASLLTGCVPTNAAEGGSAFDSALQLASQWGIAAAARAILARGGRPLVADDLDHSPLMLAVKGVHTEVVRALLEIFGPLNLSDTSQGAVALAAIEQCHLELAELVLGDATNCSPEWLSQALTEVASNGDERLLDLLLQRGADPGAPDRNGNVPIVQAAEKGNVAVLLRLARLTSISGADARGRTAMVAAVEYDQGRVIDLLAEMTPDISVFNCEGRHVVETIAQQGRIQGLIHLASRFAFYFDRDKHLLVAIKVAEKFKYDWELRSALIWLDTEAGRVLNNPDLKPRIRAALKRLATKDRFKPEDRGLSPTGMNIGLVVNARGKMCLVHDQPFEGTPLWVGYHIDRKQLEIIFDTGSTFPIDWEATDEMDNYLLKITKILLIRMENKKPVEGFDTSFLRLKDGKTTS